MADQELQETMAPKARLRHQVSSVSQIMQGFPEFAHLATSHISQNLSESQILPCTVEEGLAMDGDASDEDVLMNDCAAGEYQDVPPGTPQLQTPPNEEAIIRQVQEKDHVALAVGSLDTGDQPATLGYIGLQLTGRQPHTVSHVHDLRDRYGVAQGQAEYSNPNIFPGDRLLEIDGEAVTNVDIDHVRHMLSGKLHSMTRLTMAREIVYGKFETFFVDALRHALTCVTLALPLPSGVKGQDEPAQTPLLESRAQAGYIGIELTKRKPHIVTKVNDILDRYGILQGQPGYANAPIKRGDTLKTIDGVPAEHVEIDEIRQMLTGDYMSAVEITLSRLEDPESHYTITALRHLKPESPQDSARMPSPLTSSSAPDEGARDSEMEEAGNQIGIGEGVRQREIFEADNSTVDMLRQEVTQTQAAALVATDAAWYQGPGLAGVAASLSSASSSSSSSRHDEGAVWRHNTRQFQSAVGQLKAEATAEIASTASALRSSVMCPFSPLDPGDTHLMSATTGGSHQFKFSCESCGLVQYGIRWHCERCQIDTCFMCRPPELSQVEDRLQRVHADLQLAAKGTEWLSSRTCKHCYGVFEEYDQLVQHAARCCYNPDLITDHWKERWRCEFCSEIFENFVDADKHEQLCGFRHDSLLLGTEI